MENDSLQSLWKKTATEEKSSLELQAIIKKHGHDVMRRSRRQLIIEALGAVFFLIVYYDFFDGHQKPILANVFLVCAWLLVIIHNIYSYLQLKSHHAGENIQQILSSRINRIKTYAVIAGTIRLLAAASFLFFFFSVITISQIKYWIFFGIISIFLIQMAVFFNIWIRRIRQLKEVVISLAAH